MLGQITGQHNYQQQLMSVHQVLNLSFVSMGLLLAYEHADICCLSSFTWLK